MRDRVPWQAQVDVHVVALDLHGEAAQVVGPLVEGAARAEIEARVVPVAGEDPVAHRAAMQGKTHVRTPVVDGVDLAAVSEQADRVALEVDDEALGLAELLERGGPFALGALHHGHETPYPVP